MAYLIILLFLPLASMLFSWFTPIKWQRLMGVGVSVAQMVASVALWHKTFTLGKAIYLANWRWIDLSLGVRHFIVDFSFASDGMGAPLVALSALIMLIAYLVTPTSIDKPRGWYSLLSIVGAMLPATFLAYDSFAFYLFFELVLIPMYFLVGLWGGKNKEYSAVKFLIFTLIGSLLILAVLVAVAFALPYTVEGSTLGFEKLYNNPVVGVFDHYELANIKLNKILFWFLVTGFLIKLPSVPFHTWLPDAHVEASTPVSVILAGILLKMGGYGIYRLAPLMFGAEVKTYAIALAVLGALSVVYGAWVALVQPDLKRMVAFSSVSHMGFVLLGFASLSATGFNGGYFQMISHGITSAMLFVLAGLWEKRFGHRFPDRVEGLAQALPIFTGFIVVAFFASMGMPGFSGFVGELLVLTSVLNLPLSASVVLLITTITGVGIIGACFVWVLRKSFFGKPELVPNSVADLKPIEILTLTILALLTIGFGLYPSPIFETLKPVITLIGLT